MTVRKAMPQTEQLTELWTAVLQIEKNQERVAATLEAVQAAMGAVTSQIGEVRERLTDTRATKWAPIFAALGFGLSIIVLFVSILGSGYSRELERNDSLIVAVQNALQGHTSDGHPPRVLERVEGLFKLMEAKTDNIEKNDVFIQEHMQHEIQRVEEDVNDRINRLEADLRSGLYNREPKRTGQWHAN